MPQTVKEGAPRMTRRTWVISQKESPTLILPPVGSHCHVIPANHCLMLTSRWGQSWYYIMLSIQCVFLSFPDSINLSFLGLPISPHQTCPPAAQESPTSDTADLLGLNSDPERPSMSSVSSAPHQGVQGGLKAASSNSDLLNDLFAPPAGQPGAGQEDFFFSGPNSGATPDSKRKGWGLICVDNIIIKILLISLMHLFLPHFVYVAMGDLFDPFGMGSNSGVGSSVGSSRQASGPDLFGDFLGSDSSATSGFSSAHSNPTPASNTSLFNLSKYKQMNNFPVLYKHLSRCHTSPSVASSGEIQKEEKKKGKEAYLVTLWCFVLSDKLVNDVPKMTSSASQPDLLGGWDSWATSTTTGVSASSSKPSYTNTCKWRNIM